MFWLIPFVYSFLILDSVFSEEDSKLLLVQALFRHGDRAPRNLYPTDPNSKESWPEGLGKLTQLGKKQHYALGKFLRSMYQDFITTNPNEVSVNSSAAHRCLTGAAATMASFYAPEGSWKVDDGLNWQPIPVHYLPLYQDKYLSFVGTCPRAMAELKRQLNSELQKVYQKYQTKTVDISNYSGFNISKGTNALQLYDTLLVEKLHNLTIPEWVDFYWKDIKEISDSLFWSAMNSSLVQRLRAGPLLQDIVQNMENKINGDKPGFKVQVYSTHDVSLAVVLSALNFTNMPRPPYCATLLFELHEMSDALLAVRLLYLNSTDPLADMGEPHVLVLNGCSEFCPIQNFADKLQCLIPDDWEQECQLNASDTCETNACEIYDVTHNNQ